MHILKIIHGYPPNYNAGSEVYSQSICNELSKNNKVSVFTREENPYEPCFRIRKEQINHNLTIYWVNNPQGKDGYIHRQMDENFKNLALEIKPDIAHIGHLNHLSIGIVDVLNELNIPIVFTLHDFWLMCPRGQFLTRSIGSHNNFKLCDKQDDRKCANDCYGVYHSGIKEKEIEDTNRWAGWVKDRMEQTKSLINKVDLFIAPSDYLKNRFIIDFGIPENKIIYLDYGFPNHYLTPISKKKDKATFTFGYIGTHIPAKGINLLLDAFLRLNKKAALKIFGRELGQSTDALKQKSQNSRNKIEFAGEYINHNLAKAVFSQIDCIVVPSIWAENSPLVIHEAQACKIPVITADFGGMKEYVHHKVNGLLFKHRDANSLFEQMNYAIDNPIELSTLGKKGYLYSTNGEVPTIESHSGELLKIYKKQLHDGK